MEERVGQRFGGRNLKGVLHPNFQEVFAPIRFGRSSKKLHPSNLAVVKNEMTNDSHELPNSSSQLSTLCVSKRARN
jgi:hypothetical protein